MNVKRKISDFLHNFITYVSTLLVSICLVGILFYIFSTGSKYLSIDLFKGDFAPTENVVLVEKGKEQFSDPKIKNSYFSPRYGVSLIDTTTVDGKDVVKINYLSSKSPFRNSKIYNEDNYYEIETNMDLDILMGVDDQNLDVYADASFGAKDYIEALDSCASITYLKVSFAGGGIRGSIISTIYLVAITLVLSLPIGIGSAIYLEKILKEGKLKKILVTMIDMTSGIPSIIFGFCGLLVFIPLVGMVTGKNEYSLLAGSLTMTCILLPTIIKTTCESLRNVPQSIESASYALGASQTQTIFKIIIPNALPGILSACILSIGRIIGESAALMFVTGTAIKDDISVFKGSTSLALHIWSITAEENPNYGVASAISIVILIIVFILTLSVKLITHKMQKNKGVN